MKSDHTIVIENAEIHFSGMQIDPTVECVSFSVKMHNKGYLAKLGFLFKIKACAKFYHRHIVDISMSRASLYRRIKF